MPAIARTLGRNGWLVTALASLVLSAGTSAAAEYDIVTLVSNVPFMGADRSHLVVQGTNLYWTEASDAPLKKIPITGGPVTALASSVDVPEGINVHGQHIYWIDGSRLNKTSVDGRVSTLLARGERDPAAGGTDDLVVDDTDVYWVNTRDTPGCSPPCTWIIQKGSLASGAQTTLVTASNPIVGLAGDATHIYWEENRFPDPGGPASAVKKVPKTGGTTVVLASGLKALRGGLTLQGGEVFFADTNFFDSHRLMKVSIAGGPVTILAEIVDQTPDLVKTPRRLAADSTSLYWIDASAVSRLPLTGGAITVLASGLNSPADLAVDAQSAIWTETRCCAHGQKGSVKRVPVDGGPVAVLVDGVDAPGAIALDATHVYWIEGGPIGQIEGFGRIAKVPLTGGPVTTVVSGIQSGLAPIAADDTNVYVADRWAIKKVPIDGGKVERLAIGDFYVGAVATDGVYLYWIERDRSAVRKVPVDGGPIVTLAAGFGPAGPIAVDSTHVYWIDHFDTIKKVPIGGGPVVTLAANLPFLSDLAVDGTNVYFSEQDTGRIQKMSVDGGLISTLAIGVQFSWNRLTFDAANVFWTDQRTVATVPKAGGPPTVIAFKISDPLIANAIAADQTSVYWTEVRGGTIKKATLKAAEPRLALALNRATFRTGDALSLTAAVTPAISPRAVDVYLAVRLPDGTLLFFPSFTPILQPVVTNWTVVSFSGEVFRHTFTGGEPPGSYIWLAAFTEPGTLNFIGPIVSVPFTFSP